MSAHALPTRRVRWLLAGAAMVAALVSFGLRTAPARATVWLCQPGMRNDPCTPGLSTTVYNPALTRKLGVQHPKAVKNPPIDCFYVYPTVSDEQTPNADLRIQDTERSIALYQASRYSQYCRVFAPMYRQVTLAGAGLAGSTASQPNPALGLADVEHALAAYLKHDNHGRGFVLIGHSQGSGVLEAVIAKMIDPVPSVRSRLLSAILMGGNVLQKGNTGIGGTFKHIPACRRDTQLECVIAFSTFDQPVPSNTKFGIPGAIKALGQPNPPKDDTVLCTNPANLAGGSGLLDVIQPSAPFAPGSVLSIGLKILNWKVPAPKTVYWAAPHAYSAKCVTSGGAHVLMIKAHGGAQTPTPAPDPSWGLHLLDANVALGNLIAIVKAESGAFVARHHG